MSVLVFPAASDFVPLPGPSIIIDWFTRYVYYQALRLTASSTTVLLREEFCLTFDTLSPYGESVKEPSAFSPDFSRSPGLTSTKAKLCLLICTLTSFVQIALG